MSPFEALVATARDICTPDDFLNLSAYERDMLATTAAARYGTTPLDHRDDPYLIRKVYRELVKSPEWNRESGHTDANAGAGT